MHSTRHAAFNKHEYYEISTKVNYAYKLTVCLQEYQQSRWIHYCHPIRPTSFCKIKERERKQINNTTHPDHIRHNVPSYSTIEKTREHILHLCISKKRGKINAARHLGDGTHILVENASAQNAAKTCSQPPQYPWIDINNYFHCISFRKIMTIKSRRPWFVSNDSNYNQPHTRVWGHEYPYGTRIHSFEALQPKHHQ